MKNKNLVLFSLFVMFQSYSRTTEVANEPLQSAALRADFCSHLSETDTGEVSLDERSCRVVGAVIVVQKIFDRLVDENILTGLSLNYSDDARGLFCSGRAIKSLKAYRVDDLGNIQEELPKWRIVDAKCNSTVPLTNEVILSSSEGDDNVKALTEAELEALPQNIKAQLIGAELVTDGDSAYYSVVEDTTEYFKVLDPEDLDVVLGYLTTAQISYSEDPDEVNTASAYFNAAGARINEVEEF